ncbi:MAG: AsmA-like C-terminal region-containing protein, partial [Verrucomicrobiales bacterium]
GLWSQLAELRLNGRAAIPVQTNGLFQSEWTLQAKHLGNDQTDAGPVVLSLTTLQTASGANASSDLAATLQDVRWGKIQADKVELKTSLTHPAPPNVLVIFGGQLTNQLDWLQTASSMGANGEWHIMANHLDWEQSHLDQISLHGTVSTNAEWKIVPGRDNQNVGFWNYLEPYQLTASVTASKGHTADLQIEQFSAQAVWRAPLLNLLHLQAELGSGKLSGAAEMKMPERRIEAALQTTFNPIDLAPLFSQEVNEFISDIQWLRGPVLDARFGFTLAEVDNADTNHSAYKDVSVSGRFDGGLSVSGLDLPSVTAEFQLTNNILQVPAWKVETDAGAAEGKLFADLENQRFGGELASNIDPIIARDLVPEKEREPFDILRFPEGHALKASFEGPFTNLNGLSIHASLDATNFMVRDERFSELHTWIKFTNGVVSAHNLEVRRGKEDLKIEMLYFNSKRMAIYVTNGVSTMNPWLAMSLVEEEVYEAIDPYRFDTPPFVKFNGWVPLANPQQADIVFDVKGTNFHYWRLNADTASAMIYWRTNLLSVTNVQAKFYGGTLDWEGHFKFNKDDSADYRFIGIAKNADLKPLMGDLVKHISGMEGTLNGKLVVTHANTEDWNSWDGYGEATLKNGLLWSIPVFGMFSPALDAISPGLGTSKISEGSGTFQITNSVITTQDMEMRAPAFRLKYNGWVDFDGDVDANVQAQLFRDATLIGRPLSMVLWPVSKVFEGKVTGKLDNPKRTLRYFDFILSPLRSILGGKDAMPEPEKAPVKPKENGTVGKKP